MHRRIWQTLWFLLILTYAVVGLAETQAEKLDRMYQKLLPKFQQAIEINMDQLSEQEIIFVDVRANEEQAVSVIPGAITMDAFVKAPERYRSSKLVAYCTIGYRSGRFAIKWQAKGYDVKNLKGGVLAWAQAGKLFQTPSGIETKRVHVYDDDWNFLPEDYIAIW